jgi:hypothetical protein
MTMKLQELKDVKRALELPILLATNRLRWGECDDADDATQMIYQLANAVTCKADLHDHIVALEAIVEICATVAKGRYLEDHQRCHGTDRNGPYACEHACQDEETANCEMFDARDPHTAILGWLEDLRPFREDVRRWIEAQLPMHRGLRDAMWGPEGLFGGSTLVGYAVDDDGVSRRLSDKEINASQAERDAKEDRAHEAMANRIDQYELNLDHIRRICEVQGDLHAVATMITEGFPPQLRQSVSPS